MCTHTYYKKIAIVVAFNDRAVQTSMGCQTPTYDEIHGLSERRVRHTPQLAVTKYRDHIYEKAKQQHECLKYINAKPTWQEQFAKVPDDCTTRDEIFKLIDVLPVAEAEIFRRYMETQVNELHSLYFWPRASVKNLLCFIGSLIF